MKRPETKFHAHAMRESQVTRSKKVKIYRWVKLFLQRCFFSLYWYFIETTTTDIDMLSQVWLQFRNNNGFVAIYDVIMWFCSPLDGLILCRIGVVRQEAWSHSTWFGKCSIRYAYWQFQLL